MMAGHPASPESAKGRPLEQKETSVEPKKAANG